MSIEIKSKEELVEAYRKINLDLTFGVNIQKNQPTAKAVKIVSKATRHFKSEFYYRYKNEEQMIESVSQFLKVRMTNMESRAKEIQNKRQAKKELVNSFKVGQILYDSWGYDQTNIDFYQVVGLGAKSVKIRKIAQKYVRSGGFMCEYVTPDVNNFISDEMTKIIQCYSDGRQYIKERYGCIFNYEGGEIYQSHYA